MPCRKCHKVHGKFKNGKLKKTCPGGQKGGFFLHMLMRKRRKNIAKKKAKRAAWVKRRDAHRARQKL